MSKLAQARIDEVTTCQVCGFDLALAELPVSCGEGKWRHPECEPPKPILVKEPPKQVRASQSELVMRKAWGDAVSLVRSDFPEASHDAAVESATRIAVALFERTVGV